MTNLPLPAPIPLDKPGAGVPFFEKAYLRYYMKPFVAARSDWAQNWTTLDNLNARLFAKIEASQRATRTTNPDPAPARLEDSRASGPSP